MQDEIVRDWEDTETERPSTTDKFDNTVYVDDAVMFGHERDLLIGTVQSIQGNVLTVYGPQFDRDYTRFGNQVYRLGNNIP